MTEAEKPLVSIAVFGRSNDLWPVALLLQKNLPPQVRLTVVEDAEPSAAPSAISLPADYLFHAQLGLAADDVLHHAKGSFGLATHMQGWLGDSSQFFCAPTGNLPLVEGVELHHVMLRAARMYSAPSDLAHLYDPFRFAARMAAEGKFSLPDPAGLSPTTMLGPMLQLSRDSYTQYLKGGANTDDLVIHVARAASVKLRGEDGAIQSVKLDKGISIAADFFIDVTGDLSGIVEQTKATTRRVIDMLGPFDRMISAEHVGRHEIGHQSAARALEGAFVIDTPLADGQITQLYYSAEQMEESGARHLVAEESESAAFEPFALDAPWTGNLARLGLASASLGSYQSADMRLLAEQAQLLVHHLPAGRSMQAEADAFNLQNQSRLEEIRDFMLLPFALNQREGSFWQSIRGAAFPDSLQRRIEQFKSRGRFVAYDHELFDRQQWIEAFIALGVVPDRVDPRAEVIDMNKVRSSLKHLVDEFTKTIATAEAQ